MDKWRETVDFVRLEMLLANCGSEWVKICIHTETQTRSQGLFILYCQFIQCKLEIFFAVNFCSKKRKLVIKISKCKNCLYDWLKMTDFFAGDYWVFAKICFFGQGFWKCYALFSILFPVSLSYSVSQIKKRVPSCLDKNQQYFLSMTCSQEAKQIFSKKIHPILRFHKTMEHKNWTKKMFQCWNRWLISSLLAPSYRFARFFHLHGIFLPKWASFVFDYVHLDTAAFVICSFMNEVHRKIAFTVRFPTAPKRTIPWEG